jgi:hypothetical protein
MQLLICTDLHPQPALHAYGTEAHEKVCVAWPGCTFVLLQLHDMRSSRTHRVVPSHQGSMHAHSVSGSTAWQALQALASSAACNIRMYETHLMHACSMPEATYNLGGQR